MAKRDDRQPRPPAAGRTPEPEGTARDDAERPQASAHGHDLELETTPLELLATLARLDLEAALAYEEAARHAGDPELEERLTAFADDHRRHVGAISRLLEEDGEAAVAEPVGAVPLLGGLMRLAGPLGPEVVVVALLANEQLTNLSYDAALAYEWEEEIEGMLQEFQADEERHLAWLSDRHDRLGGHAPEAGLPGGPD